MRTHLIAAFSALLLVSAPQTVLAQASSDAIAERAALCLTNSKDTATAFAESFGPTSFTDRFHGHKSVIISAGVCSKVTVFTNDAELQAVGMAALSGAGKNRILVEIVFPENKNTIHAFVLE